jgi:hypothetical protein
VVAVVRGWGIFGHLHVIDFDLVCGFLCGGWDHRPDPKDEVAEENEPAECVRGGIGWQNAGNAYAMNTVTAKAALACWQYPMLFVALA